MATRTRSSSGGSITIQYEGFQPMSELKEEEAANILLVHLPDFQKEQIKVTYVNSSREIRIVGERGITNNTWSRFNEAFSVPQNCDVQKIHGRFQNGLLTITLPKITIVTTQPTPTTIIAKQANDDENKKASPQDPKTEQEKAVSPQEDETMKQKDAKERKELREGNEKKTTTDEQQEENNKKRKESLMLGTNQIEESSKKKNEEDEKAAAAAASIGTNSQKQKERSSSEEKQAKEDYFGEKVKEMKNVAAAAKKTVIKGFAMETSEERQSLVNMGVAILVIAALGAYISYSYRYGSSAGGDSKD